MADVYVEKPHDRASDLVDMLYITIESSRIGEPDEAQIGFETRRGFGFRIRKEDAVLLAQRILRIAAEDSDMAPEG